MSRKQPAAEKVVATNRRARYDYHVEDTYEAGLKLTGTEVKALRDGFASLNDGYGFIEDGEVFLDIHIGEYRDGTWTNHAPKGTRKLLLHKREIVKISHAVAEGGYTLIPLRVYFTGGRAKVELAVAKGKKAYDKRHTLREQQDKRDAERAIRERTR